MAMFNSFLLTFARPGSSFPNAPARASQTVQMPLVPSLRDIHTYTSSFNTNDHHCHNDNQHIIYTFILYYIILYYLLNIILYIYISKNIYHILYHIILNIVLYIILYYIIYHILNNIYNII